MNSISFSILEELGSDLSSRQRAASFRERIVAVVAQGQSPCGLDFSGVRSVSHSFADELFAVLVEVRGESWFKTNLKLSNLPPVVRQTILEAIHQRLSVGAA